MSKFIDSIIRHAVGDAIGVPTEFCIREYLLKNPVKKWLDLIKQDNLLDLGATIINGDSNDRFIYSK